MCTVPEIDAVVAKLITGKLTIYSRNLKCHAVNFNRGVSKTVGNTALHALFPFM